MATEPITDEELDRIETAYRIEEGSEEPHDLEAWAHQHGERLITALRAARARISKLEWRLAHEIESGLTSEAERDAARAENAKLRAELATISNALTPIDRAPPLCGSEKG